MDVVRKATREIINRNGPQCSPPHGAVGVMVYWNRWRSISHLGEEKPRSMLLLGKHLSEKDLGHSSVLKAAVLSLRMETMDLTQGLLLECLMLWQMLLSLGSHPDHTAQFLWPFHWPQTLDEQWNMPWEAPSQRPFDYLLFDKTVTGSPWISMALSTQSSMPMHPREERAI